MNSHVHYGNGDTWKCERELEMHARGEPFTWPTGSATGTPAGVGHPRAPPPAVGFHVATFRLL